ncbi:hypothetical protein [Acuticoccus mangrovi]|uniref:Uncharacterized protein n=1 Tax=Acuticoccus mangrovi TaxID=2796142 RepID=A0A934MJQ8_9HYPH|nr:hypothetical protein [Acuticoccus mangrovi]MBJ3774794.1 hypothetical protein [Acuticoccus mangrovi]
MLLIRPLAAALIVLTGLIAVAETSPAFAQTELRPCRERKVGSRTVKGNLIHVYRIRPEAGTACRMNMNIGGNIQIRQVRVTERPKRGKLVTVRRNQIVYQAGRSTSEDLFGISFNVINRHGTGWVNVAVQVQPRR